MKLTFRAPVSGVLGLLALIAPVAAQTRPATAPQLRFGTASVKIHPTPPNAYMIKDFRHGSPYVIPTSGKFVDTAHVQDLLMEAYGVTDSQIMYQQTWMRSPYGVVYDIEAQSGGNGTPTPGQLQEMLQALLADRFHLAVHWETKPKVSVYALVLDKNGPKFKAADDAPGTTLFVISRFLTQNLDSPVVDRTGLPAVPYDFDLDRLIDYRELDREQQTDQVAAQDYIRSTIPHELGLRLESRKESVEYLVIDHIDQLWDK